MDNPVKEIREALGLTRSQFTEISGLNSVQYIHNIESGKHNVGINLLEKIVKSLNNNGHKAELTVSINVDGKDILVK